MPVPPGAWPATAVLGHVPMLSSPFVSASLFVPFTPSAPPTPFAEQPKREKPR
ncbi:hypothetical protein FDG2_5976 [Candidatus Protofrankia californiensis]|uniref:Uncharacterized protein n=1 Tax=Candidatus Protofrankia californiensis TaxID=1839754 RepID=A0A1C3PFZ3_9ACTN|nr:hypothetical protein FDG2_5976 [Candidatus Protofrankia californiensis]